MIAAIVLLLLSVPAGSSQETDVSRLLADIQSRDWQVRREAALRLGKIARPDGAVVAALDTALTDVDSRVRRSSAAALGRIGPAAARATRGLINLLEDRDPQVARSAANALGSIGRKASRATEALKEMLEDPDSGKRLAAADALARMNRATPAASAALARLLDDPDGGTRAAAAQALGRLGEDAEPASGALVKRLGDDDPQVRGAAVTAFGDIGETAVPALIASLSNGNPLLLQTAVEALARIGEPAVPPLIETFDNRHQALLARQYAAKALARIGNRRGRVLPALVKQLEDPSPAIRIAAIEALGGLGPQAATVTASLVSIINNRDEDTLVREYAIVAAARVAPTSPAVNASLIETVADSNAGLSGASVAALLEIRSVTENAGAVSGAIEDLGDADAGRRLAAARALADLGPYARSAVTPLAEVLGREANGPELRTAAARALGMIGPPAEPALPSLNSALHSGVAELSDAALVAMQRIGPATRTIPALRQALKDTDLGVRDAAAVSIRKFALARLDGWQTLLAQSDAPVLRAWIARHEALYGVDASAPQRPGSRHLPATTDYFDVLGGRAAIRESVQLQSIASPAGASRGDTTIPIESVGHITVPSHPYEKMLRESGHPPGSLPLADFAPADHLFALFRDPRALRDVLEEGGDLFLRFDSAFSLKRFEYDLEARYLARMGLPGTILSQLADLDVVGEIALILPDLFVIDGTDITAIARLRSPGQFGAVLRMTGLGDAAGTMVQLRQVASGQPLYWARRDDLLFVSTNAEELHGVLANHDDPKRDSLGRSDEFRYMLQQLPLARTTRAYFYISDPFIRRLIGPGTKIAQLRRAQARADLDLLTAATMLFKMDGNTAAPTTSRLAELGYAPRQLSDRDYTIGDDPIPRSEKFGTSAALKPLSANPVTQVSQAENAAYRGYADNYWKYWRQFFDPIAIRLDAIDDERSELTTFILPLLDSSLYKVVREDLTGAGSGLRLRVPQLTPAPMLLASMNLSDDMRLKMADLLAGMMREFTSVDPDISDAFAPTVHLAVQDSTPIIAVGSGDILGAFSENLLQMEGFEPFLPVLLSLVSQPSSLFIELAEPQTVLKFLRDATSGQHQDGGGEFHQVAGEDTWIYTVDVFHMVQIHLRVAIEKDYLVISNLPWSSGASLTGTAEEPLNGARLELNLDAMSQRLPALHTRASSDDRIAAVDGMGYLYPLLASGVADSVEGALDRHSTLFGFRPIHPAPGHWLWKNGAISSTMFGTPQSPVQPPYQAGDRDFGLFPTLRTLSVSAQLEDTGLRTRVAWRRVAH